MTVRALSVPEIISCHVRRRLNRFVVEVEIEGIIYRAHLNNTGRLTDLLKTGTRGYCLPCHSRGMTTHRLIALECDKPSLAALIDTSLQMKAFEGAVAAGIVPWLKNTSILSRNVRIGKSLIDYLLMRDGREAYLEVKSAVFRRAGFAMYPDCPTARGRRHIRDLTELKQAGWNTTLLFIAALPGVKAFSPNYAADEALYHDLLKALASGVELRAIRMALDVASNAVIIDEFDLPVVTSFNKEFEK